MPQMSPLMWMTLFMLFTSAYMMFMSMNFFSTFKLPKSTKSLTLVKTTKTWKW